MYIQNKVASAFYKLSLGLISLYGFWMTLALFGATAWRLFSTWMLFVGAIYFCVSALILALSNKRNPGDTPCAMLEGALIVTLTIQFVTTVSHAINGEYLPGLSGFAMVIAYYILPVLALLDWCLFNKKGQWRAIDPFYWLALPLAYCATIILTANMLPSSTALLYPVTFLDYNAHGLWEMLCWLALLGLLILIFGYILFLLDAFMGGKVAKHLVLPHIRTVTIDDEADSVTKKPDAANPETTEPLTPTAKSAEPTPAPAEPTPAPAEPTPEPVKSKTNPAKPKTEPVKPNAPRRKNKNKPTSRKINDITRPNPNKPNNLNNKSNNQPADKTNNNPALKL